MLTFLVFPLAHGVDVVKNEGGQSLLTTLGGLDLKVTTLTPHSEYH